MLIKHLLTIALLGTCITAHAQTDTITIKKKGTPGAAYRRNGKAMNMKALDKALKTDAVAYAQFKRGKSANGMGSALGFAGGFLVGYDLGRAAGSGTSVNPAVLGAGVALIAISVPFAISGKKKVSEAVRTYNDNLGKTSATYHLAEGRIGFTGSSIGLSVTF